jgi:hypothetical protein
MNTNQIPQIVIGFVLTIAVSGLGFIWGEIDSLKQEVLTQRIFALEEFRNAPSRSAAEVEKLQMQIDYMYRELVSKIGHIENME